LTFKNYIKNQLSIDKSNPDNYQYTLQKRILFLFATILTITLLLLSFLNFFIFPNSFIDAIVLLCASFFCLIAIYLNWKNKYNISATMIMIAILGGIVFNMINGNGIYDPGTAALIIFTIISSLLFKRLYVALFTLLSLSTFILVLLLQHFDYINKKLPHLLFDGSVYIILIFLNGLIIWVIMGNHQSMLELIYKSLHEKNTLLKEIHHRVKNNMQIISSLLALQESTAENEIEKNLFKDNYRRIQAMAKVHELMYQSESITEINISNYIESTIQIYKSKSSLVNKNITFIKKTEDILLDLEKAIPVALIIDEIISNSTNHAFIKTTSGLINISLREIHNKVELIVSDNGIGFSEEFSELIKKHFGLKMIEILNVQLKGKLTTSSHDGVSYQILFPK